MGPSDREPEEPPFTIPEVLEAIEYDPRQAARSVAIYSAMIGLGIVLGAVFTALAVGHAMDPIDPGARLVGGVTSYRLSISDLLWARDYVATVGLGAFLAGAIALGALELEWF